MANKNQADSPHASQYEIHPPEGVMFPPDMAERWQDLFRQAGLSPQQAQDVQRWYWLLNENAKAHQVEREILRPQEVAALTQRQHTLMQKRHTQGINPGELKELMRMNERLRALQGHDSP